MSEIHNEKEQPAFEAEAEAEAQNHVKPNSHLLILEEGDKQQLYIKYKTGSIDERKEALSYIFCDKVVWLSGIKKSREEYTRRQIYPKVPQMEFLQNCVGLGFEIAYKKLIQDDVCNSIESLPSLYSYIYKVIKNKANDEIRKAITWGEITIQPPPEPDTGSNDGGSEGGKVNPDPFPSPTEAVLIKQYEGILTDLLSDKKDNFCSRRDSPSQCGCVIANYVRNLLEDRIEITPAELKEICRCSARNARNWRNEFRSIIRKKFDKI